jgi:hypothetical protein
VRVPSRAGFGEQAIRAQIHFQPLRREHASVSISTATLKCNAAPSACATDLIAISTTMKASAQSEARWRNSWVSGSTWICMVLPRCQPSAAPTSNAAAAIPQPASVGGLR